MMGILTNERFLKTMRRSADTLAHTLKNISQKQAENARDGADGWNVVEVVCHLRDCEAVFFSRAKMMVNVSEPQLEIFDHEQAVIDNNYAAQMMRQALDEYLTKREQFIAWLETLKDDEWQRAGIHPETGRMTVFESAVQCVTHDVDHLEQITRILNG